MKKTERPHVGRQFICRQNFIMQVKRNREEVKQEKKKKN